VRPCIPATPSTRHVRRHGHGDRGDEKI
jgi:hypothetical protein